MADARTILGALSGSRSGERLQVALRQRRGGRLEIELTEQHHAEGIGWFDQRALRLSGRQLRELQAILGQGGGAVFEGPEEAPATLPFPGPDTVAPRRATGTSRE